MDANEFFNNLMEKIEKQIPDSDGNIVKQSFGGKLSYTITCTTCNNRSEREESFTELQIEVKSQANIMQSIKSMVNEEILEGENAYWCEMCSMKVKAIKSMTIAKLPNYLIFNLKRFEYDLEREQRFKVNDYFEFSEELDLSSFCKNAPKAQSCFELCGVVIHQGSCDTGHYFSLIKHKDN
jgi:ubiquitin C-terminal hydrolase